MALQPREKKLAVIVGALGGLMLLWLVATGFYGAFRARRTQLDALQQEVQKKTIRRMQGALVNEQFYDWGKRSLPSDRDVARTAYQGWLVGNLSAAKLENVQVEPGRMTQLRDVYTKLPYTIRAQGSFAEIVGWLASFSEADHLHLIRDLTLQPMSRSGDLQMTASVEALVLAEADRKDKLTTTTGARLDDTRAAAAKKTILDRNLFAAYVPPPPPRPPVQPVKPTPPPPPPPVFDTAKYTFLTSIVSVNAEPEAWLLVRTTNELLKLRTGDAIKVGQFQGKLVRIGAADIEIERGGKRSTVALGKSIEQSTATAGEL